MAKVWEEDELTILAERSGNGMPNTEIRDAPQDVRRPVMRVSV